MSNVLKIIQSGWYKDMVPTIVNHSLELEFRKQSNNWPEGWMLLPKGLLTLLFLFSVGFRYMVRGFSHDPFWSSHKRDDYVDNNYGIIIRIQTSPNPLLGCPQSSAEKIFPSEDLHFLQIPTLNPMLCICTHSSSHRWGFTIFLSYYSQIFFRLKTYFTQILSDGSKKFTTCCVLSDTPLWKTMRQAVSGKYEAHYL